MLTVYDINQAVMILIRSSLRSLVAVLALSGTFVLPSLRGNETCLHRTVSVIVTDRNWAPIAGLNPADFRGEFRGRPVKILSVVPDNLPHRIVIVLDASGSFASEPGTAHWQLARMMASHLAESKLQNSSLALLIFNDKVQEQIDFSERPGLVAERLRQIAADPNYLKTKIRGKTALWDTVLAGLGLLRNPTSADDFYLITDGGENASRATPTEMLRRLAPSGSRMFLSFLPSSLGYRNLTAEEITASDEMIKMAHATGGAVFGGVTKSRSGALLLSGNYDQKLTFSTLLDHFYQTMVSGHRMEIELPNRVDKWRDWKLELSKEKQREFKDFQLGYTRDLPPCAESQK
jgi:hypothetical protein